MYIARGELGRRGSSQAPNEVHMYTFWIARIPPCYFESLIAICSVCHRYCHTCHRSNGSWPTDFGVVVCFRVAASARATSSVLSCRAGWLHTVLLYDPTAEFSALFHLVDMIWIPERVYLWPSLMMMSWCLMSSDVIWHIRDKLWPMPKHGSVKSTYVRCMRV